MVAKAPNPKQVREQGEAEAARERTKQRNAFEVKAHVDDNVHTFRYGDVKPSHVRKIREALDSDLYDPVLRMLLYFDSSAKTVALDKVAELVFLARLQAGDDCSFADIEDSFSASSVIWFEFPSGALGSTEGVVFDDPPASDGS